VPQKFHKGDLVQVAKRLPEYMRHFGHTGKFALVVKSYQDAYGGGYTERDPGYTLRFRDGEESSWWPQRLLRMVKRRGRCRCCGQDVPRKLR
jgi:hypothetical protein